MNRTLAVLLLVAILSPAMLFAAEPAKKLEADPEATKLLAEARAARAVWTNFPGFTADIEAGIEGKKMSGSVSVNEKGKVELHFTQDEANPELESWAKRTLASVVGHRLDSGNTAKTPCAFADSEMNHPHGRKILVLEDEMHSSYRIRDNQLMEVHRQMKEVRFTITMLENRLNEEKKYLSAHFVVNTWDVKTDALKSSEAHHQGFERVGKYDLPTEVIVTTAGPGKQETRFVRLTKHKLTTK